MAVDLQAGWDSASGNLWNAPQCCCTATVVVEVMSCEYLVARHALVHQYGVASSTYVLLWLTNTWVYTISLYISCILRICGMWAAAGIYMVVHLQRKEEEEARDKGGCKWYVHTYSPVQHFSRSGTPHLQWPYIIHTITLIQLIHPTHNCHTLIHMYRTDAHILIHSHTLCTTA